MRNTVLILAVLTWMGGVALSDEVTIGELPFPDVKVLRVADCNVVFRTSVGNRVTKPLSEVRSLRIAGSTELNRAEKLMQQSRADDAVSAYDRAIRGASETWMRTLIRHRLLRALDQAALINRAVEEWLTIMDANDASAAALSLRPRRPGTRGSKGNRLAIDLLKVKLDRISDDRYSLAIKELLLSLYRVEGRDKEAVALAQELTKTVSPKVPSGQPPSEQLPPGELRTGLDAAGFLIEKGQADRALLQIKLNLKHYSHGDLPKALLLAGKAQVLLAQKANAYKRRQLLLQGGLNFMRVAVFFPGFSEAPEGLYQAGRVNAMLGNHQAAAKTYTLVIERYAKSDFADKAQAELAAMQNR